MNKKVIIISSNREEQNYLSFVLTKFYNCTITVFNDGLPAFEFINQNNPDLVLFDLETDYTGGISLFEKFRTYSIGKRIKTVAITSNINDTIIRNLLAAGIENFLVRPFDNISLYNNLEKIINKDIKQKAA